MPRVGCLESASDERAISKGESRGLGDLLDLDFRELGEDLFFEQFRIRLWIPLVPFSDCTLMLAVGLASSLACVTAVCRVLSCGSKLGEPIESGKSSFRVSAGVAKATAC
jgi:hypothetical protein